MKKLLFALLLLVAPVLKAQPATSWDEISNYWVELSGGDPVSFGSVTSVGLSVPVEFNISGSPITTSGTIALTWQAQTQNLFFIAPVASTGVPTFRALDYRDLFSTWGDGECLKRSGSAIGSGACAATTGAPTDATYITQTADSSLSAEQALSSLSTGLMRVATTTGVITSLTDSAGLAANLSDEVGSSGGFTRTGGILLTKSITVENPTNAEKVPIFITGQAATITDVCAAVIGSSTPSVTFNVKYGSDLSAAGTSVTTTPAATTSVTAADCTAALNNTAPAASDHVWLITTAQSGTVNYLNVTVTYTIP